MNPNIVGERDMREREKMRKIMVPSYFENFQCIGTECEDNCCESDWKIAIDKKTYKKYKEVNHPIRGELLKYVKRDRKNSDTENYARIIPNSCGSCSFLDEDKLCGIQKTLGEDYLSNVCLQYPRYFRIVDGVVEKSLTFSCPEVARAALFEEQKMEFFVKEELEANRINLTGFVRTNENKPGFDINSVFWDLRIFTIEVLQNREYSIEDRLIILGLFYKNVQDYLNNRNGRKLLALIAQFRVYVQTKELMSTINEITPQRQIQMKFLLSLALLRLNKGVNDLRYLGLIKKVLIGVGCTEDKSESEIMESYISSYNNYYLPYIKNNEQIFEHYLVNHVFKELFPLSKTNCVFEEYVKMVLHYALIKLHLIGIAGYYEDLNDKIVVGTIQPLVKVVEHSQIFLSTMMDVVKKNNYSSMAYMAILVKN